MWAGVKAPRVMSFRSRDSYIDLLLLKSEIIATGSS